MRNKGVLDNLKNDREIEFDNIIENTLLIHCKYIELSCLFFNVFSMYLGYILVFRYVFMF